MATKQAHAGDTTILDHLNKHTIAAVNRDNYQAAMSRNGMIAAISTPDEIRRVMAETAESTGKLMRELNLPQID